MTTIAVHGWSMGGDTQTTDGTYRKWRREKVIFLPDGSLFGACGDVTAVDLLRQWAADQFEGKRPAKTSDAGVLLLSRNGDKPLVRCLDSSGKPYEVFGGFYAIGTGSAYAMGAMHRKATLIQALETAAEYDAMTSGPFVIQTIPKARRK